MAFYKIFFAVSMGLLFLSWLVNAEQSQIAFIDGEQHIIDEITITEKSGCALVTVKFNFPAQYIRHFPKSSGNELHIKLSLLAVSPSLKKILSARESILPPPNDIAALSNVNYEGNVAGGPFLILYFTYTVSFKVKQGTDFRSLIIDVSRSESKTDCLAPAVNE